MCIDDPGRVVAIDALGAIIETPAHRRRASTLLIPDVAVGDWVTVAAGTIVDRLTDEEAAEIRSILDRAAVQNGQPTPRPAAMTPASPAMADAVQSRSTP
jgi:hydrogenase assembly chaperone HypC/HupF